jgi:hypothetical protein
MAYLIEAKLSDDLRADIAFTWSPPCPPSEDEPEGWPAEVWIIDVLPLGVVPPMTDKDLLDLADRWLTECGGHDACCRHVQEREGSWE